MNISKNDRSGIQNLHGVSNGILGSRRDASNTNATDSGPWKGPPTTIPVPGQNPFNRQRLQNNLFLPRNYNRSANTMLNIPTPTFGERNPKRQKTSGSGSKASTPRLSEGVDQRGRQPRGAVSNLRDASGASTSRQHAGMSNGVDRSGTRPVAPDSVTFIESDDDIGEPVRNLESVVDNNSSPDPLNISSGTDLEYLIRSEKAHAFDKEDSPFTPRNESVYGSKRVPTSDGPSTSRLQAKTKAAAWSQSEIVDVDAAESDPIQDADNWPSRPEGSTKIKPKEIESGNTRGKIAIYEPVTPTVRHIPDLQKEGRKARMKANRPQQSAFQPLSPSFPKESALTSSSRFTKTSKQATSGKNQTKGFHLPLKCWSLGRQIFGKDDPDVETPIEPYTLIYNEKTQSLIVAAGQVDQKAPRGLETFRLDRGLGGPWLYNVDGKNPIIQLEAFEDGRNRKKSETFKPGTNGPASRVTFKFEHKSTNWSPTTYQALITILRKQVKPFSGLDDAGSRGCWHGVVFAAIESVKDKSRKTKPVPPKGTNPVPVSDSLRVEFADQCVSATSASTSQAMVDSRPKPRPAYKGSEQLMEIDETARPESRLSEPSRAPSPLSDPDELILVYPPTGTGAVNITRADLKRLQPGEFLNDTLIEFGLKLWLNDLRSSNPELADQIYVFSSFFYKKLNNRNREEGYQSVRKWTSKFDIFKKKYIIVPINEHLHWYLAVICEPEHILLPPIEKAKTTTRSRKVQSVALNTRETRARPGSPSNTIVSETVSSTSSPKHDEDAVEQQLLGFGRSCSLAEGSRAGSPPPHMDADDHPGDVGTHGKPISVDFDDVMDRSSLTPLGSEDEMQIEDLPPSPKTNKSASPKPGSSISANESLRRPQKDSAVPAARFYSSSSKNGKQKAVPSAFPMQIESGEDRMEAEIDELTTRSESTVSEDSERPTTHIFTLDSLGTRHPQVIKVLTRYLQWEAKDKKGLENTSEAYGKDAQVPLQPNYCDCGVYLIHFAKTFMKDPARASRLICSRTKQTSDLDRKADWEAELVSNYRDDLSHRILELSDDWKKERAAKEEEKRKLGGDGGDTGAPMVESSDDEVIVEDVVSVPAARRNTRGMKRKADSLHDEAPVTRLR